MTVKEVMAKHEVGEANSYVSFAHGAVAAAAAADLARLEQQYIGRSEYNFIWRVGQILRHAGYFAAVSHEAGGVYRFDPAKI